MKVICVDAGFLIGLYDPGDQISGRATKHFADFFDDTPNVLLITWPILYESISTRLARGRERMAAFERDWRKLELQRRLRLLDDREYRDKAVDECFQELGRASHYRALSAADRVLRGVLSDPNVVLDAFITFNPGDFRDVCQRRRLELHT